MVSFSYKSMALVLLPSILALCFISSSAEFHRLEHAAKNDGSLSFLVVGDWGRRGTYNQSQVATQMGRIGDKLDINFVISTGDNFYDDGLTGVEDKAFQESFTNIYTAESLQKQWYAVLGNHDYRGDAVAQLSPVLRKLDSRWLCLRSYVVNAEIVEFFFVDTTPFVEKYWLDPEEHTYDWRDVAPRNTYMASVLKDLESALKGSSATWKIVVGHHTIRSASHHGDTQELVNLMLPMLRTYKVDFYINGHDHCLQHIIDSNSPLLLLTSGAGSKSWRGDTDMNHDGLRFFYDGQGFMSVQLTPADARIIFYDVAGNVLHRLNMSKEIYAAI
ncbi:purple acid phosphatase 17-like [Magnolia sinica]|uniref:purple acid phosphatase 17-like n=1 Tax=Magnolia sinica TaxID=86752 RepID=UPI00265A127D|nr:purple acid phosphatase 17-like [Magnolia sinica]